MTTKGKSRKAINRAASASDDSRWRLWTVAAPASMAAFLLASMWRYIRIYHFYGDDYALVWNSASPYVDLKAMGEWFTEGYAHYFWNYPDWPSSGFRFIRPVNNIALYLESLLSAWLGDSAFLIAGYVTVVASVALMMGVLRRYTNMRPATAAAFSLALGFSPLWVHGLFLSSWATNSLASMFALAAILVLDARRCEPNRARILACAGLLVLAVLSHETAIVMPFVCVALIFGMSPRTPKLRDLAYLAFPVLVFLVPRLLVPEPVYYLRQLTDTAAWIRDVVAYYATNILFPFRYDLVFKLRPIPRPLPFEYDLAFYGGLLVNVAGIVLLAVYVRLRPLKRRVALLAAVLFASVPILISTGEPRFGGFAFIVSGMVIMYVMAGAPRSRAALVVALLCTELALFSVAAIRDTTWRTLEATDSHRFFNYVVSAIRDSRASTIVLVNDRLGQWGSLAMLKMALRQAASQAHPIVLNSLDGGISPDAKLTIGLEGGTLVIANQLGADQYVNFYGVEAQDGVPNQGFSYWSAVGTAESFRAVSALRPGRTVVVGFDPTTGEFIRPQVVGSP